MTSQVMVFIDYQNVHLIAHRRFLPSGSSPSRTHVDPQRIGELIVSRRNHPSELAGIRVYRGRPSPSRQPTAAAAFDRQAAAWAAAGPVTVTSRPLRYPLPALETVAEQALARVEVAAWSNTFRLRFGGNTKPWCHHLTARDYEALMDPTDYTKPPPPAARGQEDTGR